MNVKSDEWSFWFPEDGESEEDATPIIGKVFGADDAAHEACIYDYRSRDGWERGDQEFECMIRSPDGEKTLYALAHEPSVDHVYRVKN